MRAIATLLLAALVMPPLAAAPRSAAFEYVEYEGKDALFAAALPDGHYRNPILAGYYPDPSVCKAGDAYYLVNSTFAYFPGLPIFTSRDLVNWTQLGHVIDRPNQLKYAGRAVSEGLFAPAITHHAGRFYVVCTMVGAGGNFVVTADSPSGPWSEPVWLTFGGIDPSLFFDEDGQAYLVGNDGPRGKPLYEGHRAIWLQAFDASKLEVFGPRHLIVDGGVDISRKPIWIEGPHLYKRDGWYYLCAAEGGTGPGHSQVIFRSREVTGPYEPGPVNPILTQRGLDASLPHAVTNTGHADLVEGPDGGWWAVFLGSRPYEGRFYATGRETFLLPVEWPRGGWPLILPAGERVPMTHTAPSAASTPAAVPLTGNFTWRDEFGRSALDPLWMMLRAPETTWWDLQTRPGYLVLEPSDRTLSGRNNPAYLGRRIQHRHFSATLRVEIPTEPGISAGLATFQGERHHFFLAVRRVGDHAELFLERHAGGPGEVVAKSDLPQGATALDLRVEANDRSLSFSHATSPGEWLVLTDKEDATILTTHVAGGFVGATVGPHARLDR